MKKRIIPILALATLALAAVSCSGDSSKKVSPAITSITPAMGDTTGGLAVTIAGNSFQTGAAVTIGGNTAPSIVVVSSTQITAVTPPGSLGPADVVVTNPDGRTGTLPGGFTYVVPPPTVVSILPNTGDPSGGLPVTIAGQDFQTGATVTIGGSPATSAVVVSSTQITAVTPPGSLGPADVVVTNPDGLSGTLAGGFTYVVPPPTVGSILPNTGDPSGGLPVTIAGQDFQTGATVTIGGNPATSVVVVSSTQITAVTPPGSLGPADVVVTNPDGMSGTLVGGFTYIGAPPTVSSITPDMGPTAGGFTVTITGTNFVSGTTFTIGGNPVLNVTFVSSMTILGDAPGGVPGPADVVATNAAGSGTLPGGFLYFPPLGGTFSFNPVLTGLSFPVALAFPPNFPSDDRIFYTEKGGAVRIIDQGTLLPTPFIDLTGSVNSSGERGLLGITFDPNYSTNSFVYIFYDQAIPLRQRVVRYEDSSNTGINPLVLLDDLPTNASNHNGGNLAFGPDGMLYVTLGEDAIPNQSDLFTVYPGKILRMNPDGTAPTDNPWYDGTLPKSHFFAMGLRNSFDMAFHPLTGELYASENGPNVNDELNLIQSGNHYGWDASGISGPRLSAPWTDPVDVWSPPPAMTGVAFNTGFRYPMGFYGDIFVAAWNSGQIYRCDLVPPTYTYSNLNRTTFTTVPGGFGATDIAWAPDGYLYFATLNGIYRLEYN